MKERDLREPVADWFREQGYECAYERFFPSGYCDILAFRFAPQTSRRIPDLLEAIAVELKLDDIGTALYQAHGYWWGGARSYVAMPLERCRRMRVSTIDRFFDQGIGLLAVKLEDNVSKGAVVSWMDGDQGYGNREGIGSIQWMKNKLWRVHRKNQENQ